MTLYPTQGLGGVETTRTYLVHRPRWAQLVHKFAKYLMAWAEHFDTYERIG